jgi:hypothetical protein
MVALGTLLKSSFHGCLRNSIEGVRIHIINDVFLDLLKPYAEIGLENLNNTVEIRVQYFLMACYLFI